MRAKLRGTPPWEAYPARWTSRAVWPRMFFGSVLEPASGTSVTPASKRHNLVRFGADVTVTVANQGQRTRRTLRIGKGDVVLRPSGLPAQHYRWEADAAFELSHAILDPRHVPELPRYALELDTTYRLDDPLVGPLMHALQESARMGLDGTSRAVDAGSELLCLHFPASLAHAMPSSGAGALPADELRTVCEHIHRHLGEPLRVARLAALSGLSSSHFLRAFRAATGMTPARYVTRQRILAAQALLATEQSLADIALATGFSSQSQFTTTFRRIVGKTPSRFRQTGSPRRGG